MSSGNAPCETPAEKAAITQSASVAPGTAASMNALTISQPTRVDSRTSAISASDLRDRMSSMMSSAHTSSTSGSSERMRSAAM